MLGMLISAALSFAAAPAAQAPTDAQTIVPIATTIIRGDRQGLPDLRGADRPCTKRVGQVTISFAKTRDGRMAVHIHEDPAWFGAVYDHDRDGRIDHLVYPIGVNTFAPQGASAETRWRLAYWQALDTDHDGWADTVITPAASRSHQWFSGWLMVTGTPATGGPRCTALDAAGKVVESCIRTEATQGKEKAFEGTTAEAVYHPMEVSDMATLWSEMQQAAGACRFTATDLPP
jgi:hypothetical protein